MEEGSCLEVNRGLGSYWGTGWTNYPSGESSYGHIYILGSGAILYSPYNSSDLYFNHHVNSTWQGWKKLS